MMRTLFFDLRFGLRLLARQPLITLAAVLTLALGLGTTTAIFSVADAALLRTLPFPEPRQLVMVWEAHPENPSDWRLTSPPTWADWQAELDGRAELALSIPWRPVLDRGEPLIAMRGARVSAGFFDVLGVEAARGRLFAPGDRGGEAGVVVLSHRAWQRRFGGDPDILDQGIRLITAAGPQPATVIGILPPGIRLSEPIVLEEAEIFAPLLREPREARSARYARAIGRLAPGVDLAETREILRAVSRRLVESHPDTHHDWRVETARIGELMRAPVRPALMLLLLASALVFVIACANVAILLLALAGARGQEIAVRQALGADPRRVVGQVLTEGLLLAAAGAGAGWALAYGALRAFATSFERSVLPRGAAMALDGRVLIFTLALTALTVLVFGLLPALRARRLQIAAQLVQGAAGRGAGGPAAGRARHLLAIAQIALSTVLLVLAGLTLDGLRDLLETDPGFEPDQVLTLRLQLPQVLPPDPARGTAYYQRLLARIEDLPGVEAAALSSQLPLRDGGMSTRAATHSEKNLGSALQVELYGVSPGYFRAMRIPLLAGETLSPLDSRPPDAPPEVLLSRSVAVHLRPGENPLSASIFLDWGVPGTPWKVNGLVGDVRHHGLEAPPRPAAYISYSRVPFRTLTLVVRAAGDPLALVEPIRGVIARLGEPLVVEETQTLAQVVSRTIAEPRLRATLVTLFALVSLVLAVLGTYSVMTYTVTRRRHELGLRLALGARPAQLSWLMWRAGLGLIVPGILAGLAGAWAAVRLGSRFLPGLAADPGILIAMSLLLFVVAFLAIHAASRRVVQTDPTALLRAF